MERVHSVENPASPAFSSELSDNKIDLLCNKCGQFKEKHCRDDCYFNVFIEDHCVKEIESKIIKVEANDVITELFEIKNLPEDATSISIRKIKNEKSIQILTEGRILVLPQNQISVKFKFLNPTIIDTSFLTKIFTCEVPIKLNTQ